MGVLCSYIVEKQREWQREEISYELVYVSKIYHERRNCPAFLIYHINPWGMRKRALTFIEVSSFQGVLIRGV